ncbi:hypothetical protein PENTCL1PPCAC_20050, partial [Pristionchus entomophagus]
GHLDLERLLSLDDENIHRESVRNLMFGLIESHHLTLKRLIEERNRLNGNGETFRLNSLKIVEDWLTKSVTWFVQSGDDLISVIRRGFEAMVTILKKSDKK